MERLTTRCSGFAVMAWEHEEKHTTQEWIDMLTDRLAAYEDSGLEPEEIARIVDAYGRGHTLRTESAERLEIVREIKADRLRELVQAEKEGRLVKYLPGDTVYDRFGMEWIVTTSEIHRFGDGTLSYLYRCGHLGTNDYCALYSDEILTREEAEAALALKGGEG